MTEPNEYYFSASGLAVGYGGSPVVSDIGFSLKKGGIMSLIGPNGAGKSTVLRGLARQLRPVAGVVEIGGDDIRAMSHNELAKRLAVVLTDRVQPELMTCRELVAMGRYPYTGRLGLLSGEDDACVDAALRAVRADELAGRDFNALSDGQRQRILLARAICQDPDVIILDEPTSYLDIRHKLELLGILRDMARNDGITVIMSLHEIDLAQKVSDVILCVKGGAVVRFGAPEEVFSGDTVNELYDIDAGSYDAGFGSVELPRVEGEPQAFVLSYGGSGIPVYRRLQRGGAPFAAGILTYGDADWRLANTLAVETVTELPFRPISDAAFKRAADIIKSVPRVIDACGGEYMSDRLSELAYLAKSLGKYEKG